MDIVDKLIRRYEEERLRAEEAQDLLGVKVFGSAEKMSLAVADEDISLISMIGRVELIEKAISRQAAWSPDEVRPKWDLALRILNDESVGLSLSKGV